jgi:hypothetical protein
LARSKPSAARLIDFFEPLLFTFSFVFFGSTVSGKIDIFFDAEDLLLAFLALGVTASTTTGDASVSSGSIGSLMVSSIAVLALRVMVSRAFSAIGSDSGGSIASGAVKVFALFRVGGGSSDLVLIGFFFAFFPKDFRGGSNGQIA